MLLGRIMKWLSDLGSAAFKDSSNFESAGAGATAVTSHNAAAQAHADLFSKKSGKAVSFTLPLPVNGWSNLAQTLEDARFLESGYAYIVTPVSASLTAWGRRWRESGETSLRTEKCRSPAPIRRQAQSR